MGAQTTSGKVTIADIAAAAGCSIATVSRVLNGSNGVSLGLRRRVLEVSERLGYQPDLAARALAGHGTMSIGLVLPDITNPFFPMIARGAEDAAHAHGYSLLLGNTDNHTDALRRYLDTFHRQRVDGLILVNVHPGHGDDDAVGAKFSAAEVDLPMVLVDHSDPVGKADIVTADNYSGALAAVRHLVACGYTRIAMIEGPAQTSTNRERHAGYRQALQEAGLEARPEWRVRGDFSLVSGQVGMASLLRLPPKERPDAVFAANDLMAIGALSVVLRAGYKVPEEFGICGFDDVAVCSMIVPALTTVSQPTYLMGVTAVDMLIDRLRGTAAEPRRRVLDTQLIVRETTRETAQLRAEVRG